MKDVTRVEVICDGIADGDLRYGKMVEKEKSLYPIVRTDDGVLRWKPDPAISLMIQCGAINQYLIEKATDRNNPLMRECYRKMGTSLEKYWHLFYNEVQNPDWESYDSNSTEFK